MSKNAVVIGASAGGLDAVRAVIQGLPRNLPAAVFVVIHASPEGPALLSTILDRIGPLHVTTARNGEPILGGHIFVAPPDRHLVIDGSRIRLTRGPREHRFRPAIDPLFRSAAEHYGSRAIGIVLSGSMADGTHGLMTIKTAGGVAIVQDPKQALVPMMPLSAIQRVKVDYVLPTEEIGRVVTGLVMNGHRHGSEPPSRQRRTDPPPSPEHPHGDALETGALKVPPSPFTWPDCGGTLWELKDGELIRYRCHVGHGYSAESLAVAQAERLEDTLWSALRAIEESIEIKKRVARRAESGNLTGVLAGLNRDISAYQLRADALRSLLLESPEDSSAPSSSPTRLKRHHGRKRR